MTIESSGTKKTHLPGLITTPEDLTPIGKRYLEIALDGNCLWCERILAAKKLWYLEGDGRLYSTLMAEYEKETS